MEKRKSGINEQGSFDVTYKSWVYCSLWYIVKSTAPLPRKHHIYSIEFLSLKHWGNNFIKWCSRWITASNLGNKFVCYCSRRERNQGSNCSVQFAKHALWCTFCVQSVGTRITFSLRHKILLVRVLYWGCKSNTGFHSESKSIPSRNILKIYIYIYTKIRLFFPFYSLLRSFSASLWLQH